MAQIPALLICISAGFVVTRVGGEEGNLGSSIIKELFSSQKVLFITASCCCCSACCRGFPLPIFLALAAGLFVLAAWRVRVDNASLEHAAHTAGRSIGHDGTSVPPGPPGQPVNESRQVNETVPLLLLLPPAHHAKWRSAGLERQLREDLHLRVGMQLPYMLMREHDDGAHRVVVMINEITAASADIVLDHVRVLADTDELAMLDSVIELPGTQGDPRSAGSPLPCRSSCMRWEWAPAATTRSCSSWCMMR